MRLSNKRVVAWLYDAVITTFSALIVTVVTRSCHRVVAIWINKLCGRSPQYAPAPCKLIFDLLTLKVVSESRDVGYLCVNFSLPRLLCSRLSPNVRDRQTDRRQTRIIA